MNFIVAPLLQFLSCFRRNSIKTQRTLFFIKTAISFSSAGECVFSHLARRMQKAVINICLGNYTFGLHKTSSIYQLLLQDLYLRTKQVSIFVYVVKILLFNHKATLKPTKKRKKIKNIEFHVTFIRNYLL